MHKEISLSQVPTNDACIYSLKHVQSDCKVDYFKLSELTEFVTIPYDVYLFGEANK
jgi:hypothetical protein